MTSFQDLRERDAPLEEKLRAYEALQRQNSPEYAAVYDRLIDRLDAAGAIEAAPGRGDKLAPFALPDADGRIVSSDLLLRDGPLVVSFNRGTWCSYCLLELTSLGDAHADIRAAGASVVSVMPDRAARTKNLCHAFNLPFPVVTDLDNGYALANGLMMYTGRELQELMAASGIDLEDVQGNQAGFIPIPATYVLAQDGTIIGGGADIDFRRRVPVEDILAALRASPSS